MSKAPPPTLSAGSDRSAVDAAAENAMNALAIRVVVMVMEGSANAARPGYFSQERAAFALAAAIGNLARIADESGAGRGDAFIDDTLTQLVQFRRAWLAGRCEVYPMERFKG